MKLSYDPRYNVAYISLREKREQVETLQVSDELNIDLSPDGTVYGIELLDANRQLGSFPVHQLVVVNEKSGESATLELAF